MINEQAGFWNDQDIWKRNGEYAHMSNLVISLFGGVKKPALQFTSLIDIHNSAALMILRGKGHKNIFKFCKFLWLKKLLSNFFQQQRL